jgi:hypothetical protein
MKFANEKDHGKPTLKSKEKAIQGPLKLYYAATGKAYCAARLEFEGS